MAVTEQTPLNAALANGVTTVFSYSFLLLLADDLTVKVTNPSGISTTKTLGVDYTVAGVGATSGGTVTFLTAPVSGHTVTIYRDSALERRTDYQNNGDLLAATVNADLDRLWLALQEIFSGGKGAPNSLRVPNGETIPELGNKAARASRVQAYDGNGDPTLIVGVDASSAAALALDLLSSNAVKGTTLVNFLQSGTGAIARLLQKKLSDVVSIKDFGAVGDGVTDDSAAFAAAYKSALSLYGASSLSAGTLFLPPGTYLITANNFLGSLDFTTLTGGFDTRVGLTIKGAGWGTVILWKPSSVGTDQWMYDQGTAGTPKNHLVYATLQDLTVAHDVTNLSGGAKANGFRLLGTSGANGVVQGFKFLHTRFSILDYGNGVSTAKRAKCGTFMKIGGTVNSSEMTWTDSVLQAYATVLDIGANGEAVNHNFNNTSAELIFGDVFKIGGGHSVNVRGGSWILESETTSYLLAIRQGAVSITGAFLFEGGRTELRINSLGTYLSGWFLCDATGFATAYQSSFPTVKFLGWTSKASGTARNTFVIDAGMPTKITIDGCSIGDTGSAQLDRVSVNSSKAGLQAANTLWWMSELDFMNGDAVLFDNVTFTDANSTARISSRSCRNSIDYDLAANGVGDQIKGRVRPLKTATIWGTSWPDLGNNSTMQLRLPKGSLLKKAMFRKAANGGAATAGYRLAMVDGALNQYVASAAAAQNTEHKALADNLNIYMDDALGYVAGVSASQVVFLLAPAGALGSAQAVAVAKTDYAMVEYW